METGKHKKPGPFLLPENWVLNKYQHTTEKVDHKVRSSLSSSLILGSIYSKGSAGFKREVGSRINEWQSCWKRKFKENLNLLLQALKLNLFLSVEYFRYHCLYSRKKILPEPLWIFVTESRCVRLKG